MFITEVAKSFLKNAQLAGYTYIFVEDEKWFVCKLDAHTEIALNNGIKNGSVANVLSERKVDFVDVSNVFLGCVAMNTQGIPYREDLETGHPVTIYAVLNASVELGNTWLKAPNIVARDVKNNYMQLFGRAIASTNSEVTGTVNGYTQDLLVKGDQAGRVLYDIAELYAHDGSYTVANPDVSKLVSIWKR